VKCIRHRSYILASCEGCQGYLRSKVQARRDGGAGKLTLVRVDQEDRRAALEIVSLAS
jgi:hypothetical protein